jgi:hypothetical protein
MFKVGTIVSVVSPGLPLKGIVVNDPDTIYNAADVSMVLVTTSGRYQGNTYPFTTHQLEIISEPS